MQEIIRQSVLNFVGGKEKVSGVAKLYGDASYRTYFRVRLYSGRTFVVMKMPAGAASVSEEITNYQGPKDELPYINISNYLRSHKIPVPEIYFYDKENEALILEDVGDRLFFEEVSRADDGKMFSWYRQAIDLLCLVQERAEKCRGCMAFKRSFDRTLLNWEFDHFLEYGLEARLGKGLEGSIKKHFTEMTRAISDEIVKMDYIFTHRDYQSRNLMVKNSKLYILDFQDALLGPASYDLAALARDSYVEISDSLLDKLVSYYCDQKGLDKERFRMDFDLVTIQRKLKDAGRFVFIDRVKGNSNYLVHVPRSLDYVKKALMRQTKYTGLFEVLRPFVPEWS